jgi:hypothetical protein
VSLAEKARLPLVAYRLRDRINLQTFSRIITRVRNNRITVVQAVKHLNPIAKIASHR